MIEKIELSKQGIEQLLKSAEISEVLSTVAGEIQGRCGDGYETDLYRAQTRNIASVYTDEISAMADNLKNNTLLKAVH